MIELELQDPNFPRNCYCKYTYDRGATAVSFRNYHIDMHPCLAEFVEDAYKLYGGNLSVKFDKTKRLMSIGQDESTYHQFIFSKKYWKVPTGLNFISPKGEGGILIISRFQSREFGLGLRDILTPEVLAKINENRTGKNVCQQKT